MQDAREHRSEPVSQEPTARAASGELRVRTVGGDALLLEVDDPAAWYAELRRRQEQGVLRVLDIVPGARTVLLDGLADPAATAASVHAWRPGAFDGATGRVVEIPVTFDGPDLADVAARWRVGTDEAVRRLEQTAFHVAFCGFAPGFAYLEGLDEEFAVPRLPTPRPKVPAGSVGLADRYAGIYPTASPGGWRLVGRTDITLFEPTRRPPALLSPGVRVRFVATGTPAQSPAPGRSRDEADNDRGPVPGRAQ